MFKQQQFVSHSSPAQKIPTTVQLPKIDKRFRKDSISTIQPRSRFFQEADQHSNAGSHQMTSSSLLRLSSKKERPQLKTDLLAYEYLENLLAMKTVPFSPNEYIQKDSFWKSFKKINEADTSTESTSNKRADQKSTKRGNNCETRRETKFNSCRIINSKKIPFKISHQTHDAKYQRNRSLWNISKIQTRQESVLENSFSEQLQDILKQF